MRILLNFLYTGALCYLYSTQAFAQPKSGIFSWNGALYKKNFFEKGIASYYSDKFVGKTCSSGEIYTAKEYTAAHKSLPFGTLVLVESVQSKRHVVVRINDRGPFIDGRVIDLSYVAAKKMRMLSKGIVHVNIYVLQPLHQVSFLSLTNPRMPICATF